MDLETASTPSRIACGMRPLAEAAPGEGGQCRASSAGPDGDRDAGFALIESIAVLALTALVFLTLLIAADMVSRGSAAAARRANELESLATGLSALRRDIASAVRVRAGERKEDPLIFAGDAQSLSFVNTGESGRALVRVEVVNEDGRGALIRSTAPLLPQTVGFAGADLGDRTVVIDGPWSYRFSYAEASGGSLNWRRSWGGTPEMPSAIRVEILDPRSGQRVTPPLAVALTVNADAPCPPSEEGGEPASEDCAETPPPDANEAGTEPPPGDPQYGGGQL